MKQGIYKTMPVNQYRSDPSLGSSQIKALKDIQRFLHLENNPLKETSDMHRGTLIHSAVLEKDTKSVLLERHPYEKRAGWKEEDHDLAIAVQQQANKHPLVKNILKIGVPEVSVFAELCGVPCKGRIDWYQDLDDDRKAMTIRGGVPFQIDSSAISLYDLKTLGKGFAEQEAFMKYVANNGLHIQAAFYYDLVTEVIGHPPARFSWIAIERDKPHMMAVYDASDWLDIGRYEYQRNLQHYRDYLQLTDAEREQAMVSGYHQDERVLPVPGWVSKQHEQRGFDEY
jgi:hypothetical protein